MHYTYSKQLGGLDIKIWLTLGTLILMALGLFGYRAATVTNCPAYVIKLNGAIAHKEDIANTFYVNENINFNISPVVIGPQGGLWNFGDKTPAHKGSIARHSFAKAGNYMVTVLINGNCNAAINIHIIENPFSAIHTPVADAIISNDNITQGDSLFVSTAEVSDTYEWSVAELPQLPALTQQEGKIYIPDAGVYTLTLKIANDKIFQKKVLVNPILPGADTFISRPLQSIDSSMLPPGPPPIDTTYGRGRGKDTFITIPPKQQEPQYEQLPENEIKRMLQGVIDKKKTAEDFNNVLCDGGKTKVIANGSVIKFSMLVEDLGKKKGFPFKTKHKIEHFKLTRDAQTGNCVKIIYIDYK